MKKTIKININISTGGYEDYFIMYDPLYDTDSDSADVKTGAQVWGERLVKLLELRYPDAEVTYTVTDQTRPGMSVIYEVTSLNSDDEHAITRAEALVNAHYWVTSLSLLS